MQSGYFFVYYYFSSIFYAFAEYPVGVWIENADYQLVLNKKKTFNLHFNGYIYAKEASFKTSTNWICTNGHGKADQNGKKCTARCITRANQSIKLNKHQHNHKPGA